MKVRQGYTPLICPACGEAQLWLSDARLACRKCRTGIAHEAGVHALAPAVGEVPPTPTGAGAALYPTETARRTHFRDLEMIVAQVLGRRMLGEVLELGAGGGGWTWGMAQSERYQRLFATETSAAALRLLGQITAGTGAVILDTAPAALQVAPESLDLVVGRATLCREADPAARLAEVRAWLKPGGAAIFLEPCLQGKIWAAFVMETIRRFEAQAAPAAAEAVAAGGSGGGFLGRRPSARPGRRGLSPMALSRLEGGARQVMRGAEGAGEDRVFDITHLTHTGYEAGFAECYPIDQPTADATPLRRLRNTLEGILGPEKAVIDRYAPMFEALESTFGALPETAPVAPMVYFVFRA